MRQERHIARDISYSHSAQTRGGRAMIRTMENLTGPDGPDQARPRLRAEVAAGRDFWQVMVERYGLTLDVTGGSLDSIPREGPLVMIANHPYGILDGLMMGHILSQTRGDFRILAHQVFRKARDLNRVILPISFDETKEALALNIQTRRTALDYLGQGGAIGIFPGGTVSTAPSPLRSRLTRLAQLHRADGGQEPRHGGAGLLRRPHLAAVPARQPPALHPAHGPADQGIRQARRYLLPWSSSAIPSGATRSMPAPRQQIPHGVPAPQDV